MLGGANGEDAGHVCLILTPAGPRVFPDLSHDACCDWILMDIPEQRGEIAHIVDWFTFETVLKKVKVSR